uniref:ARAD1D24838p n=1 Tax=Blastobotrys adeninivorans TaxID=409370 RepID=A0A060TAL3_BLAAD
MIMNSTSEVPPAVYEAIRPSLLSWISDEKLALFLPIIAYWTSSLIFHAFDQYELMEKYRIHTPEELLKRNKCTVGEVVRAVLLQHFVQTMAGFGLNYFEPPQKTGHEAYEMWRLSKNFGLSPAAAYFVYYWVMPFCKICLGFFIMDTWQYMLHRLMHNNKTLYKHLHSVHHRLYVPYAFGALYNSVIEGFLLDTLGAGLASTVTSMTAREAIIFYTFSTLKTVDDHCGYEIPWDPFQILFPNNSVYHDIHHQSFGIKTNFSQPFFVHWDQLFNTRYPKTNAYIAEQKRIRLEKYYAKKAANNGQAPEKVEDKKTQ